MIHKFWNVRLGQAVDENNPPPEPDNQADKDRIRKDEELMEEKVFRIWSVLSTFEESSAACISDMLLHVSNGSYVDGVVVAKRFISHVEILFKSTDRLDQTVLEQNGKGKESFEYLGLRVRTNPRRYIGLSYGREAKLLCKKIVAFFSLLSKTQDNEARKLGVTQELLSLVTGLAHYLKLLIRICLQGALRLEREDQNSLGLNQFLDDLHDFDASKTDEGVLQAAMADVRLSAKDSDQCTLCRRAIEDECAKNGSSRWHLTCVGCSRCGRELGRTLAEARFNGQEGKLYCVKCAPQLDSAMQLEYVSKLQQFIFLLQVALARLLNILSSNGAIPSNPIANVDKNNLITEPPRLTADSRSKSYSPAPAAGNERRESTYENSLNEVRRLRSTRLDRHLSTSVRRARTSKVFDADGRGPRPASPSGDAEPDTQESTDTMFGHNDAITLDDIPRIVAAEQSREKQNQQAGGQPAAPTTRHNRAFSVGKDADFSTPDSVPARITRKFFPELSALEYFNMRLLAVLTMHPLVEQEVSLEELLSFIEARKPATFWKNLGKAFKNDKSKNTKKKGVFGVPLDVIIERDGAESTDGVGPGALRVPAIVDDIVTCMRKMDLSVEGVFRKNGNIKKQLEMVERINAEGCDSVNFMEQPVVQLAALLKRYLRELPDPLMTHKLYGLWTSAAKISDPAKKKQCLHLLCCLLPKSHRDCLEILFTFLKWAGTFHQLDDEGGSKMDVRNLATVIAPNILTNPSKAPALDNEAMFVIEAVEMLITNIEEMCQVPDELLSLLNDPYLFSGPGEVTTKEILKRFQDRRGQVQISDVNEVYNRQDMSSRSPPKRVETDPSLWQAERTVRPINDPAGPNQTMGTPPQLWASSDERPSPYKNSQYTASDSNLSSSGNNQRGDWRNSAWGRQPGGLGVGNS